MRRSSVFTVIVIWLHCVPIVQNSIMRYAHGTVWTSR